MRFLRSVYSTAEDMITLVRQLVAGAVFEDPETLAAITGRWRRFPFLLGSAARRSPHLADRVQYGNDAVPASQGVHGDAAVAAGGGAYGVDGLLVVHVSGVRGDLCGESGRGGGGWGALHSGAQVPPGDQAEQTEQRAVTCVVYNQCETQPDDAVVTLEGDQTVAVFRNVPARGCATCGEAYLSGEITAELLEDAGKARGAG